MAEKQKAPAMLWIVLIILLAGIAGAAIFLVPDMLRRSAQKELLQSGSMATARIVSVADTGRRYATNPVVKFVLDVLPADGGARFNTEIAQEISMVQLAQFQPGASVQLRYKPGAPTEAMIVGRIP